MKYAQNDIVPIKAKLRYSTLIILPEKEEILDFTTGDKEFWIINGAHNLCYIHPAQAGIRSNLNLITASGHVYSFLLSEISSDPNADPDLKVVIEPKEESGIGTGAFAQGYVPATEAEAYKREIQTIRDQANAQVQTAQTSAQQQMQKFRSEYSTKLQFDYQFDSKGAGKPFLVSAIYHDDTFTYIKCAASEKPPFTKSKTANRISSTSNSRTASTSSRKSWTQAIWPSARRNSPFPATSKKHTRRTLSAE